ncbi:MAG: hypothetical protein PUJ30_00390 [Bacteroidales bacterium]|nr:hypothetical protein [Bacteroidales bacterium]MDY4621002.1 hypothetical protein [Alloprevotella sp.]
MENGFDGWFAKQIQTSVALVTIPTTLEQDGRIAAAKLARV